MHQQFTIEDAIRQGEEAADRCAAKADRLNPPGWQDLAFAWIVKWSMARYASDLRDVIFTGEDVVDAINGDPQFPARPHNDRAWGNVIKRAAKTPAWMYVDAEGKRRKGHGSKCNRYLVTGARPTEIYGTAS